MEPALCPHPGYAPQEDIRFIWTFELKVLGSNGWMRDDIITLLEIEERSVKEIADLTGWSVPLVKVRAFRARAEMKKILARVTKDKYL